jgi:hypothetical protein
MMSDDNPAREGSAGTATNGPALRTGTTAAARLVRTHRARKTLSFRPLSMSELFSGIDPKRAAYSDLTTYAQRLKSIAETVPIAGHAKALSWVSEWRMYALEKNVQRWPDGLYHLVDRGYQLWRGHDIAFTREELGEIGVDEWDTGFVRIQYTPTIRPLQAECFQHHPQSNLAYFAGLVDRIVDAWALKITENDRSNSK